MFKKNICLIAAFALFTGCVQKDARLETQDLASYWFNAGNLNNNKIVINKNFTEQYNDGKKTSSGIFTATNETGNFCTRRKKNFIRL